MHKLSKAWIVFKNEGLQGVLKKIIIKAKLKIRHSSFARTSINDLGDIQKYSKLDIPNKREFIFPEYASPKVSIIIPVYNKFVYTFNCLKSLQKHLPDSVSFEIIVVNDKSIDETQEYLESSPNVRVLNNEENLGFIRSCNRGAAIAKGSLLCFLNNDTQILPKWLESLVSLITEDPEVAAVGSKLIYANGRLQEAGGIIWEDASGWNYGRHQHPDQPEYNYVRQVDYCSGASLLVRTEIFHKLAGFSEEFLPAYYEDTDLCFAIRQMGYKVLYQPKSKLVHYEGITSGTSLETGIKSYQKVNRHKFFSKWQKQLQHHLPSKSRNVELGARRLQGNRTVLIVDSYVPLHDQEAGSCRLFNIIKIVLSLGYHVIFLPDDGLPKEPYTSELQCLGVEVLYCTNEQYSVKEQLIKRLELIDIAWLCRPQLCSKYIDIIRTRPEIKIAYDTVDLHFLRMKRQEELMSQQESKIILTSWQEMQEIELTMARMTDVTVVVTDFEKQILGDLQISNIMIVPTIHHQYEQELPSFEQREGLLFIGGYNHTPNVDAVTWMCKEIMPLIWLNHPDMKITLLGSNPPVVVKNLASDRRIEVLGYVKDVEPYFLKSRIFVAPLRYGAGMKGKIGHSFSYGLPTVTTSIGAEGMGLNHSVDVLIANQTEEFAQAVLSLYDSSEHWSRLSINAHKSIKKYGVETARKNLESLLNYLQETKK